MALRKVQRPCNTPLLCTAGCSPPVLATIIGSGRGRSLPFCALPLLLVYPRSSANCYRFRLRTCCAARQGPCPSWAAPNSASRTLPNGQGCTKGCTDLEVDDSACARGRRHSSGLRRRHLRKRGLRSRPPRSGCTILSSKAAVSSGRIASFHIIRVSACCPFRA